MSPYVVETCSQFQLSVLCGDGFMDFTHYPKSKILKY
jgi:hypothetical protein